MKTHTYKGVTWTDAFKPTQSDLEHLQNTYGITPHITQDILSPTPRPYVRQYADTLYVVFHFPMFRFNKKKEKQTELDFVIQKNNLITVRYTALEPIEILIKKINTEKAIEGQPEGSANGAGLSHVILREMYLRMLDDLVAFSDWRHDIEERIYQGKEKEMVTEISLASRELTEFRSRIYEHERQLVAVENMGVQIFGEEFGNTFEEVLRMFDHVKNQMELLTEMMIELRETNNSLVSTKQNEIMKVLTIMAFITFPLSLIASIFGMNALDIPFVGQEGDFWIIMFIMGISTLLMFAFFKYKKWI